MNETIRQKLHELEAAEKIRVLYAAESGSRACGFASPDSDYDVRFIYVRPTEAYLSILPQRDVIEWQLDETLDISGWDLQKALRLLLKSNPTLFEWANSPIIYRTTPQWEALRGIINQYFCSKAGMYHYLNMARSNYREYLKGETVRIKKYLYVLRPILACRWIAARGTPPPMLFETLVEAELDPRLRPTVERLLALKRSQPEIGTMLRIDALNEYIESQLTLLGDAVTALSEEAQPDVAQLDCFFRSALS